MPMDSQQWHRLTGQLLAGTGRLREGKLRKRAIALAEQAGENNCRQELKQSFLAYYNKARADGMLLSSNEYVAMPAAQEPQVHTRDEPAAHHPKRQRLNSTDSATPIPKAIATPSTTDKLHRASPSDAVQMPVRRRLGSKLQTESPLVPASAAAAAAAAAAGSQHQDKSGVKGPGRKASGIAPSDRLPMTTSQQTADSQHQRKSEKKRKRQAAKVMAPSHNTPMTAGSQHQKKSERKRKQQAAKDMATFHDLPLTADIQQQKKSEKKRKKAEAAEMTTSAGASEAAIQGGTGGQKKQKKRKFSGQPSSAGAPQAAAQERTDSHHEKMGSKAEDRDMTPFDGDSVPQFQEQAEQHLSKKKKKAQKLQGISMPSPESPPSTTAQDMMKKAKCQRSSKKQKADRKFALKDAPVPASPADAAETSTIKLDGNTQKGSAVPPLQGSPPPASTPAAGASKAERKSKKAGTMPSLGESPAGTPSNLTGGGREVEQDWRSDKVRQDIKSGRYSKAEKDTLRKAVQSYAEEHGLDQENLHWLFCTKSTGMKGKQSGPWQVISKALPHRTTASVWACGTRMLHVNNYKGKWEKDDDNALLEFVQNDGPRWTEIGNLLGRLPEGCRDRWKEIRHGAAKRSGKWDEEETAKLRDIVEEYLAFKQDAEIQGKQATLSFGDIAEDDSEPEEAAGEISDARVVVDDIDWSIISDRMGTRSNNQCMEKWYTQLTPGMVSRGEWGSGDDRRLIRALLESGAKQEFQVDWGNLVKGRSASTCRRRWRLMVKQVPEYFESAFHDSVMYLTRVKYPRLLSPKSESPPVQSPCREAPSAQAN
ncbi:hypothetical protein WJX74_005162 [Apatococcus lobatus]|uniref:Uncharacterized protein n=1 Tax=Apatococcus lobatus TaxID=904363 RepID=A0AAW1Q8X0_9CHLO